MAKSRGILLALLAAILTNTTALGQGAPSAAASPGYDRADSVVLERIPGVFGGPAYRLAITRAGEVRFDSRPGTPDRATPAPLPSAAFQVLMSHAAGAAFTELPDSIMADKTFCRYVRTDAATVTVSLYWSGRAKRVVDYQGCEWAPAALRRFQAAIERAAGVNPDGRPG